VNEERNDCNVNRCWVIVNAAVSWLAVDRELGCVSDRREWGLEVSVPNWCAAEPDA